MYRCKVCHFFVCEEKYKQLRVSRDTPKYEAIKLLGRRCNSDLFHYPIFVGNDFTFV